jgi:dTDP-4-dehydrorhamnose reductase
MTRLRVLVTGAGGRLGGILAHRLAADTLVVAGRHRSPVPRALESVPLSLLSGSSIDRAIERSRPDAIVHCAALADADRCEREPLLAHAINVEAPARIARTSHRHGIRLLALSTDLVFDGDRAPVNESAVARPWLVYGLTKRLGEQAVLDEATGSVVVRVALVHGRGFGRNGTSSETILWTLRSGRPAFCFTDQYRTPIDGASVADAIARLLRGTQTGVFHAGGSNRLSRYELALRVARLFGHPESLVRPVLQASRASSPIDVLRPADVSLVSDRARRELGWEPRALDAGLLESRPFPDSD